MIAYLEIQEAPLSHETPCLLVTTRLCASLVLRGEVKRGSFKIRRRRRPRIGRSSSQGRRAVAIAREALRPGAERRVQRIGGAMRDPASA